MAKFDMTQLEKAETVPAGSLHLIEMGDGSGTKAVTQETLIKETGKALKVGDLAQLQTENKENLVDAINEAAQSGGGGAAVDILDTPEEIEANTETGKAAGAAAVKAMFGALNDKLTLPDGTAVYFDMKDGVFGFNTDPERGADTFRPFKHSTALYLGDVNWVHYESALQTYDFRQIIINAGLNPNAYTADNIFFRQKSTTYNSYTNANQTVNRGYTYSDGIITTTSGYVGSMKSLTVTAECYLVV